MKLSLVCFYENKPPDLVKLLGVCNRFIRNSPLRSYCSMYCPEQVHATLTGLELLHGEGEAVSLNWYKKTGRKERIDLDHLDLLVAEYFPMHIRFGGLQPDFDQFLSA